MKSVALFIVIISSLVCWYGVGLTDNLNQLKIIQQKHIQKHNTKQFFDKKLTILNNNLNTSLMQITEYSYSTLKDRGISFINITSSLWGLNSSRHMEGYCGTFHIASGKDDNKFAIVVDGPRKAAVMRPVGVYELVTLEGNAGQSNIDAEGNMTKDCRATVYATFLGGDDKEAIGKYSCADILNESDRKRITSALAEWITRQIKKNNN